MNPSPDISTELKKQDSKELNSRQKSESPNPTTPKKATSPKELQKSLSYPIERELNTDFSLSFKEIYNYHINEIEKKTNLKINHIYYFILVAFFFFMIGYFERIFSYIITGYYPVIWTIEDYKLKKDFFWKKWGTYWTVFSVLIFFDIHKDEVLKFVPLYFYVKCIFLMMLFLPGFSVAIIFYDEFLKNIFLLIEKYFFNKDDNDTMINDFKKNVKVKQE